MALDASIYARFAPPPKSVADFDREHEDLQGARQTNALNKLRLLSGQRQEQDAQRTLQEQTGVRNALSALGTGATDDQRINALRALGTQSGFGQADALEKSVLEREKTRGTITKDQAETESKAAELKLKQFQHLAQSFAGVADQGSYDQALQLAGVFGVDVSKVPRQFSPEVVQRAQSAFITGAQQLEATARQRGHDLTQRGQDMTDARTRAEGAANRAVTMRGQSLTDDRARDLNVTAKTAAADAKRAAADEKAVTKFSDTLQKEGIPELETAIGGAEGAIGRYKEGEVPGVGRLAGAVPSALLGDEGNDVRQAIAAVRNIVLSARSGAAVTDQELRRLVEELGTGMGQSEAALRRGLQKVRARIDKIKENAAAGVNDDVLQTYQDRGGIAIKRGGKGAAPQASAGGFKYLGTE
jgi:hypothetical protein